MTNDSWNLPPGVTPSMLPGNSPREIAVERAMEEARDEISGATDRLRDAVLRLTDVFDDGPGDALHLIDNVRDILEEVQAKLDDIHNTVGQVLE